MSHTRHPLRNRAEWLLAWLLVGPLLVLPRRLSRGALVLLADLAWLASVSRRRKTEALVVARLGCDARRARAVVRGAFRTLAVNVLEGWHTGRLIRAGRLEQVLTVEGGEHLQALLDQGRGALLATAHFGSWEAIGAVMAHCYRAIYAVGRPMDNPLLEGLVKVTRGTQIAGQIDKQGAGLPLARLLRRGEFVGLLLDQNAGRASFLMDFLGAPARQHKVAGVMAVRFGTPVVPLYVLRESGGRLRLVVEAPLSVDPALEGEAAERDLVQRVSASLEAQVRAHPEQWLWLHDRWRSAADNLRLAAIKAAKLSNAPSQDGTTGA